MQAGVAQLVRASPFQGEGRGFESRLPLQFTLAPIAQLDRACGFGPQGWGFESSWARHFASLSVNVYAERSEVAVAQWQSVRLWT